MPLSEKTLVFLNELKTISHDGTLASNHDELIKVTFKKILSCGDVYKIEEIENWLNDSQTNPVTAERILNVAHYQKAKFDAKNPLKLAHDSCGCGGDC